ncbi:GMC oxidoreductase domain-containing protein [Phthorimaea operculella]|nr:GMC oxidoreductase domain-containing protein [Phthorimaea operculella]
MVLLIEAAKPEMLLGDIPMFVPYLQLTDYAWPYTMEHQPGVCQEPVNYSMVLLIEAGKPEMLLGDIPMFVPYLQLTDYAWPYTMEHQPGVCQGNIESVFRGAADRSYSIVLLIEAGKPEMLLGDILIFVPHLQHKDAWPQGSAEQRCFWPRGKAVGGTSATNFMLYTRGRPQDWDRIAADGNYGCVALTQGCGTRATNFMLYTRGRPQDWDRIAGDGNYGCATNFMLYTRGRPQDWDRIAADGNYGWSYNEVLPYYMKSQRSEVKKYKNATYSGREGELVVSNAPFKTGLVEAFLEAGRINGHPTVDYNAPDGFGFGYVQTTTNRGHRWSAAKAFLHPHKRRRNLHILPDTRATKIVIEPQTKRAYAVEYIRNNKKYTVRCRREIILSAGPIASPQLLMLSGIGPKEHLQTLGIPVIADLQVGRTLYDHITFPGVVFQLNSTNASLLEPKVATLQNLVQWMHFGDGLLAGPGTVEGIGYLKTEVSDDPEPVPDIELISLGTSLAFDAGGIFRQSWKITDKAYYTAFGPLSGKDTWSAFPMLLHPKSRGYLELRDTNPFSHPKMYGNYYTDPKDIATMIAAIRYIIKLGESQPFKKYGARLHQAQFAGCETHPFGSDSYWECALRSMVMSLHHQIATCKMGPPTDPEAVVDPELRVYGVEGLRVVDSSVIPRTTAAHTNAPAIMIGEKAADMIKKTWANVVYS